MALIEWLEADRQLHIANGRLSYVLAIHDNGALGLLHAGGPLATGRSYRHVLTRPFSGVSNRLAPPGPARSGCPRPGARSRSRWSARRRGAAISGSRVSSSSSRTARRFSSLP